MKNIKYLIITLLSLLMVQTSFADDEPKYKGVKVTDKNGKVTTHFHVDSIQVYNDTVRVWNQAEGLQRPWGDHWVSYTVPYEVDYYKPQNVEVFDKKRGLRIFAGDKEVKEGSSIDIYLGLKGSVLTDEDKRWCNTYAMPYSKKLVAKDIDGNILDVEWTTKDPLKATVSPDGSVMGHAIGKTELKATSLTGETRTISINTKEISHEKTDELKVHSFFPGSEGYKRYFDRYYATGLGVWNSSKCKDYDNAYNKCNLDVNKGLGSGTSDIYVAVNFDKDWDHDTNDYITNVIAVYSTEAVDISESFKIDERTYHYASMVGKKKDNTVAENRITDLNDGAGGSFIYLAYTKDEYKRNGDPSYLVSHSALAFYGDNYVFDWNLSDEVKDNKNFTRLIRGDKGDVKDAIKDYGAEMLNLGSDDEVVKAYTYDPKTNTYSAQPTSAIADFQYNAEEEQWITMACTYEPYFPPANRWMGALADDTPINTLSIPGTHDSSTANISSDAANALAAASIVSVVPVVGWIVGTATSVLAKMAAENAYMGRTQRFGYRDQFRHGVRLFDIRVDGTTATGDLVHGSGVEKCVSNYTFKEMLTELNACLNENQSEFVILEVKIESGCEGTGYPPAKVWEDINNIIGRNKLIKYKKGLTLNDCRNKVLVKGLDSPYVTFKSEGDWDYYEIHRNADGTAPSLGYVGDDSGKIASPLWCSSLEKMGNINNSKTRDTDGLPATKYGRAIHQLFNYSKLPADRDTWLYTDLSGYFVGVEGKPSWDEWITGGKFDTQQSSYMNSRIAHYIKGMNGSPCGIVRMDFAGTNYADQDQSLYGSKHIATTYGYYLCQEVIRNNFIGKEKVGGKYTPANGFTTEKDPSPTRGSEPVYYKCKERTECGWVQLWEDGPKFAEFNVGSAIGTYMGMTSYDQSIVGGHYKYPKYGDDNAYDRYEDNASQQWGVDWRTPTPDEISALLNSENTTIEYIDGEKDKYAPGCTLKGYKISGKGAYSENSIFLPAAGIDDGNGKINGEGINGLYWGRNPKDNTKYVVEAKQNGTQTEANLTKDQSYAEKGLSIRPVFEKSKGHPKFKDNRLLDDYYELEDAEDLLAFSAFVNGDAYNGEKYHAHTKARGKLMQDIDMSIFDENKKWKPIGKEETTFQGRFDGQNHRIKNHHGRALFHAVGSIHPAGSGSTIPACYIENVIIDSTCVITGDWVTGGLVDYVYHANGEYVCLTIRNCGNEATVINQRINGTTFTAGLLGALTDNQTGKIDVRPSGGGADIRILDSYNTGKITDQGIIDSNKTDRNKHHHAAINGPLSGHVDIVNCWNTGSVYPDNDTPVFSHRLQKDDGSTVQMFNCYSVQKQAQEIELGEFSCINPPDVSLGHLCYDLNKNYQRWENHYKVDGGDTIVWHQKIGAEHPTICSVGNDTVYVVSFPRCDDAVVKEYRNDTTVTDYDIHKYDANGFCKRNGTHYEPAANTDDKYFILNAGNLYWFAREFNAGNISSTAEIMMMAHIVDNENVFVNGQLSSKPDTLRNWTPIGTQDHPFSGTIHGNGAIIKGLYCKGGLYAGLLGNTKGVTMECLGVEDSYFEANASSTHDCYAGALAGYALDPLSVKGCYSNCHVRVKSTSPKYRYFVGGLVGSAFTLGDQKAVFSACYSTSKVDYSYGGGHLSGENPLFGNLSGVKYAGCFHNNKEYSNGYKTDREFEMGVVCDELNKACGSLVMSQWIGSEYKTPFFGNGNIGNFIIKKSKGQWNSITVPYKVKSDNYVQYYTIEGMEDVSLKLKSVDTVEPNTPCFMRYLLFEPDGTKVYPFVSRADIGSEVQLPEKSWNIGGTYTHQDGRVEHNFSITVVNTLEDVDASTICESDNALKGYQYCYFFKDGALCLAEVGDVKLPAFTTAIFCKSNTIAGDAGKLRQLLLDKQPITLSTEIISPESGQVFVAD